MTEEFLECDTCRAKPGTPVLCSGCLHNRSLIATLRQQGENSIETLMVEWRKDIVKLAAIRELAQKYAHLGVNPGAHELAAKTLELLK